MRREQSRAAASRHFPGLERVSAKRYLYTVFADMHAVIVMIICLDLALDRSSWRTIKYEGGW